jgi:hypothetical protein
MAPGAFRSDDGGKHGGGLLILMAKAGYDPHAARDLWLRMAAASQGSGRPPEFHQIEAWIPEAMQSYRSH